VPAVARVNAGVQWRDCHWRVGATYRERFEVPFATQANTEVAGEPIDLDLRASGQFTPDEFVLGGAWVGARAKIDLDATYSRWSSYPGPFVIVTSELPLVGPLAGALPTVPYQDTIAARLGGEVQATDAITVRGGYAFESSPIPADQSGETNLLDGPKHTIGLGMGIGWKTPAGKSMRLDLHVQAQLVQARTLHKVIFDGNGTYDPFTSLRDEVTDDPSTPSTLGAQISNPGYPTLHSGGQVFSGGLTLEAEL
jgi:long-subunit fatty acid transport protein